MRTRWRLWLAILLLLLVVGLPAATYFYDPNPIRYANYEQIKDDMTDDDISALLGCPPGDHRTGFVDFDIDDDVEFPPPGDETVWSGDRGDIIIYRDAEGRMTGKRRIVGRRETRVMTGLHALWAFVRGR